MTATRPAVVLLYVCLQRRSVASSHWEIRSTHVSVDILNITSLRNPLLPICYTVISCCERIKKKFVRGQCQHHLGLAQSPFLWGNFRNSPSLTSGLRLSSVIFSYCSNVPISTRSAASLSLHFHETNFPHSATDFLFPHNIF